MLFVLFQKKKKKMQFVCMWFELMIVGEIGDKLSFFKVDIVFDDLINLDRE